MKIDNVDFITFCHPGDIHRLYHETWLSDMVNSHEYQFDNIRIVHQRCDYYSADIPASFEFEYIFHPISSTHHPNILSEFGLPEQDEIADHYTHGPTALHYWKWHVINHLIGLKVSAAKYIVFSDNDCLIRKQINVEDFGANWIGEGIRMLEKYPEILIVSPGDGATMFEAQTREGYRLTQNVSQQLFLCEREKLASINFNVNWGGEFRAPGGPMQEYYFMLEGRIWRYMDKHNLWRCILPDYVARYWHCNRLTEDGFFEGDYERY